MTSLTDLAQKTGVIHRPCSASDVGQQVTFCLCVGIHIRGSGGAEDKVRSKCQSSTGLALHVA